MINLQRVSYVRLGTRDIEGAIRFATDVLGLEIAEVSKGAVYSSRTSVSIPCAISKAIPTTKRSPSK